MLIFLLIFIILLVSTYTLIYTGGNSKYIPQYDIELQCNYDEPVETINANERICVEDKSRNYLIRDIYVISNYWKPGDIVVYGNAAPGFYLDYLVDTFPDVTFNFYSESQFAPHDCEVINRNLSKEDAGNYDQPVIFINNHIVKDIDNFYMMQNDICKSFKNLKIAVIPVNNATNYSGKIYIFPYSFYNKQYIYVFTECKQMIDYTDIFKNYYYFQKYIRNSWYEVEGMQDHCYDCWAEKYILTKCGIKLPYSAPQHGKFSEIRDVEERIKKINAGYINFIPHYSRLLGDSRESYKIRDKQEYLCLKAGQRKLLMTEIEFYTKYAEPGDTVVYAGAAPGHHNMMIFKMFPDIYFEFYDTNKFHEYNYEKCVTYNKYFTAEDADHYGDVNGLNNWGKSLKKILFLTDIRTGSSEDHVKIDMELQRDWCIRMLPNIKMAMIKFRLPWEYGSTEYFDGEIYTQPRIGCISTETRLYTDCKKNKIYDNDEYNDRLYYYNRYQRNAWHDYDMPSVPGICHCHDCWSETQIFQEYINKYGRFTLKELFDQASKYCMQPLTRPPHGLLSNERDINLKIKKLKEITEKYVDNLEIRKQQYSK